MPTHASFILMSDARCRAPFLRKNRPSWTTTTVTMIMTTRRFAQRSSAQKSGQPSDNEHTFLRVRRRRCNSRNVSGMCRVLSHHRNLSKPCVSRPARARSDDGSREMQLQLLKSYIIVHYDLRLQWLKSNNHIIVLKLTLPYLMS